MSAHFTLDRPVAVTCPDCGGALRQNQLGTLTQFRCHIGHVYTTEAMLEGQFTAMESSIEAAMRSLNERVELCRQMVRNAGDGDDQPASAEWKRAMDEAEQRADALRDLLERAWTHPEPRAPARAAE